MDGEDGAASACVLYAFLDAPQPQAQSPVLSVQRPDIMMPNIPTNPVTAMSVALSKSERIDIRATPPVKQLLQEATRVAQKT